ASVTSLGHGNGSYTRSGYPPGVPDGSNPWSHMSDNPFMEGASVVVFYGQMTATGNTINATEGASFSGPVATFTEPDASALAAQYSASIDWGDGSVTSGTVSGPTGGPFTVSGSHTYATGGPHTIQVHIVDDGGSTANTGDCSVTVYTPVPFAIGNGNSANGTHVTFWGAQWWMLNTLSGGSAPA